MQTDEQTTSERAYGICLGASTISAVELSAANCDLASDNWHASGLQIQPIQSFFFYGSHASLRIIDFFFKK